MPKPIRSASVLLAFALAVLALPGRAPAQQPCDGTMNRLPLLIGTDGAWVGTLEGQVYRLSNIADDNAIETIYVDPRSCEPGSLDISVEVKIVDAPQALGGLIYARVPEPLSYLALVMRGDGTVRLYARGPKGLEELARFDKARLAPGDFNRLRIQESPGQFEIYVNGARVGTVKTDMAGTGAVGILAGGKGEFLFREFAVAPAGGAVGSEPQSPEPAAQAAPSAEAQPEETGPEPADVPPATPPAAGGTPETAVGPAPDAPEPAAAPAEPAPGTPMDLPLPPVRPPL